MHILQKMKFLKKPSKRKRIIQNQILISFWYIFKKHGFFLKELKNRWKKIAIFFQYFFFLVFQQQKNKYLSKEDTKHPEQNIE